MEGGETQVMGTLAHLGCPLLKNCELLGSWRDCYCLCQWSDGRETAQEHRRRRGAMMQSWKDNLVGGLCWRWWWWWVAGQEEGGGLARDARPWNLSRLPSLAAPDFGHTLSRCHSLLQDYRAPSEGVAQCGVRDGGWCGVACVGVSEGGEAPGTSSSLPLSTLLKGRVREDTASWEHLLTTAWRPWSQLLLPPAPAVGRLWA